YSLYTRLSSSLIIFSFSFHRSVDPPDLHSFPTRRSSDLLYLYTRLRNTFPCYIVYNCSADFLLSQTLLCSNAKGKYQYQYFQQAYSPHIQNGSPPKDTICF